MGLLVLLLLPLLLVGGALALFLVLAFLALLIYDAKNLYPTIRTIALWAAEARNFIPVLALGAVLLFVTIVDLIVALQQPLAFLLVLQLIVGLIPIGILLALGILVYVLRIIVWLYRLWRTLIMGGFESTVAPQLRKMQLKHDIDERKDWTATLDDVRSKLLAEVEQQRNRIISKHKKHK